jgi:glycerol uptake facilitator-like aquaporin
MPLLKDDTKDNIKNTAKESFLILLYEMIGTAMMTALISNYFYEHAALGGKPGVNSIDNTGLLLGMFVTIMFSARISGSHFNPCITFSYMVGNVKHGNFDRMLGFLYIAAQLAGAFLGSILAKIFASGKDGVTIEMNVESD